MKQPLIYLYVAWVTALIASLGSICLGELNHNYPCILCWMQRICMFPLGIILGVAFVKRNTHILPYVILFPILGILISGYHIAVQEIPSLDPVRLCGMGPSCVVKHDLGLGKITFPMLSLLAFSSMLSFLYLAQKKSALSMQDLSS